MLIGLTGGIGSGKTIVAKLFETMGCVIYNSDIRAKELYFNDDIKQQIIALLGNECYLTTSTINTEFIAKKIFSNIILLTKLNTIIHPAVKKDFNIFKSQLPLNTIIIKESALLFETELHKEMDVTILVTAPLNLKIQRIVVRSSLSRQEIEKRISAQWMDEQRIKMANFIIVNDDKTAITPQVEFILNAIKL